MKQLPTRTATEEELLLVHTAAHVESMKEIVKSEDLHEASYRYNSVYFHPSTFECATVSAGSILQVVDEVLNGLSRSGVCVVRPPGHHAESDQPNGFCLFNNVSIAAQYAIQNHGLKRVLIVDWDVHHGQGTQHIFENDPRVLYISVHRYDNGNFFPKSTDADYKEVGGGLGKGFNVNIPWNKKGMADMEYMLAFQSIILPITYDFNPELVLVSAGFDAAIGDQLGGCKVTPEAYGFFTQWLSALANGRIILCLEGGYNVNSISHSMALCAKSLLGDPLPMIQVFPRWNGINSSALESIKNVINTQSQFWKCLKFNKKLPDFDINDNKISTDLARELETMSLGSPNDADDSHTSSGNSSAPEKSNSSPQPGPSGSADKTQTLTDYLSENLEVSKFPCFKCSSMIWFLIQALKNEEMFAVVPRKNCPHLSLLKPEEAPESKFLEFTIFKSKIYCSVRFSFLAIDHNSECCECHTAIENWFCLFCFKTFCSRYVNEHSALHSISSDHPLTISFSDLSVWCYKCEAYIDNPQLHKFKNLVHRSKFGEDLVWSYGDLHIDLTIEDDSEWYLAGFFPIALIILLLLTKLVTMGFRGLLSRPFI